MFSDEEGGQPSYWPSVSDLFMTLFIIAIALVGSVFLVFLPKPAVEVIVAEIRRADENVEKREAACLQEARSCRERVRDLEKQLDKLKVLKGMRVEDRPPIITVADADKRHFFASGSASLSQEFERDLRAGAFQEVEGEIAKRNQGGQLEVDTLEIIGHTDGVPVSSWGNLDNLLPTVLAGNEKEFAQLSAGSNNDLGLLRALAIKIAWKRFVSRSGAREELEKVEVRTYSAGQTIPVDSGEFATENARSRRIEMRLTKLR